MLCFVGFYWPILEAPSDKSFYGLCLIGYSRGPSPSAGQICQQKEVQPYISNGRYFDRLGSDLLKKYPLLVGFIFLLLAATEHFEDGVSLHSSMVIKSICSAVLGELSAFHLASDRSRKQLSHYMTLLVHNIWVAPSRCPGHKWTQNVEGKWLFLASAFSARAAELR